MVLICEIALLVFGIIAIATGKLTLSKKKVVHGVPARLIGLIGLLPIPLSFIVILIYAGRNPQDFQPDGISWVAVGIEVAILAVCAVVMFSLGAAFAGPPPERPGRRRDDVEYDEEVYRRDDRREPSGHDRDFDRDRPHDYDTRSEPPNRYQPLSDEMPLGDDRRDGDEPKDRRD